MQHRHIHGHTNDGEIKVCVRFDGDDAAIKVPLSLGTRRTLVIKQ